MADQGFGDTGSQDARSEGKGFESSGIEGTGFGNAGFGGPGIDNRGIENTGFWSQEEFVVAQGAFGESADGPQRRRFGRRAAAAVGIAVALGAGGYGVAVAAGGSAATPSGAAAQPANLSAAANSDGSGSAPGCGLVFMRGAAGTLKSDNGSTLTVQGPDNSTRTVNTTSSTVAVRIASGSLADVVNGDNVLVGGTYANNTLTAKNIVTGSGLDGESVKPPQGSANWLGYGFASGTVADKTSSGFTVLTPDGGRVAVATSSSPTVDTTVKIAVSALRVGQRVAVSGTPDSKGTITATQVEEIDTATGIPGPGFGFGPGPGFWFGPRGAGPLVRVPHALPSGLPSDLPSGLPQRMEPPKGWGGFGLRAHGGAPAPCDSATPAPSAPSGKSGA